MPISLTDPSILLPLLTTLIGTGALTIGIYSFLNPSVAARIYGVPVPTNMSQRSRIPDLTKFLVPSLPSANKHETKNKEPKNLVPDPTHLSQSQPEFVPPPDALHLPLAARNLTTGLTILLLTAYWQWHRLLHSSSSSSAPCNSEDQIRTALGLVVLTGSIVPFVDAWGCCTGDLKKTGRRAGWVHVVRGCFWVGGGLWCLGLGLGSGSALNLKALGLS